MIEETVKSKSKETVKADNAQLMKVKLPFESRKKLSKDKDYIIKCNQNIDGKLIKQETEVSEDGEVIFTNSLTRKNHKTSCMIINIGEIVLDGKVNIANISLCLMRNSHVELKLKYSPDDM